MGSFLDKKMKRLKAYRAQTPEYDLVRRKLAGMSNDLTYNRSNIDANLGRRGESINAQVGAGLALDKSVKDIYSGAYDEATAKMLDRQGQYDAQIENVQTAIDQDNERKRLLKDQSKDNLLKTGLEIGGAALGAAAGSIIPGAGTLIGAQIGAGLGGAASGFVGGGGDIGTQYTDYNTIMTGVSDTIAGISAASNLNEHKQVAATVGNFITNEATKLSSAELLPFISALQTGDMDIMNELLRSYYEKGSMAAIASEVGN